jgi:hypothetical protein
MKEPPKPPPNPPEELLNSRSYKAFGTEWVRKWLDLRERDCQDTAQIPVDG